MRATRGDVIAGLPYRDRLALTLRRSAELCDDVGAWSAGDLFRRAALEIEGFRAELRKVIFDDEDEDLLSEDQVLAR